MVRLAMATMDIIKLMERSQQILDVGGGASKDKAALKLIIDENVNDFNNIFGGIMRGDVLAQGLSMLPIVGINIPLVVRLVQILKKVKDT